MKEINKNVVYGILVVISATLIHFTFGYFYTLGNMAPYLTSIIRLNDSSFQRGSTVWLSAASLAIQGISMPVGGILSNKIGYRSVVIFGCLMNSGGTLLTYFTIEKGFIWVLLTYSVVSGFGLGFAYSVTMATAATWFPKRRAIIYGIVAGGFGIGGILFTPIQRMVINPNNVLIDEESKYFTDPEVLDRVKPAFLIFGGILVSIQALCCFVLHPRPEDNVNHDIEGTDLNFQLDILRKDVELEITSSDKIVKPGLREKSLSPLEVLKRHEFYLLWGVMFCNIIPITLVTAAYKVVGSEHINNDNFLSIVGTLSAIFNSFGRIFWGGLVDKYSFKLPIMVMLLIWSCILITLPHIFYVESAKMTLYAIWICGMYLTLSGVFAMMPAATSQLFGSQNFPISYGLIFSSFSFGSVLCAGFSQLSQGHWTIMFTGCGFGCLLAAFLMTWIHDPLMPRKANICLPCTNACQRLQPRELM